MSREHWEVCGICALPKNAHGFQGGAARLDHEYKPYSDVDVDRMLAERQAKDAATEAMFAARRRGTRLTWANDIVPQRVRWFWDGRLAMGTMSLLGGREGQGKSLFSTVIASQVTRGTLPGALAGEPRNVIIVTAEDAWEFTIVPRLMANGADLSRVARAEATVGDRITGLSLSADLEGLEAMIVETEAALVIFDPLMSRLDGSADTHKDADVRTQLEPVSALAERTGVHVMGLIHVNKTATSDPLTSLMGSRAFAAVARSVVFIMKDPDQEADGARLLGLPKNNLGRTDWPTKRFRIEPTTVGDDSDDGEPIVAPRLVWIDDTTRTVEDALLTAMAPKMRSKTDTAGDWLVAYLRGRDGEAPRSEVIEAGARAGVAEDPILRARPKLGIEVRSEGFPKVSIWSLPSRLLVSDDQ